MPRDGGAIGFGRLIGEAAHGARFYHEWIELASALRAYLHRVSTRLRRNSDEPTFGMVRFSAGSQSPQMAPSGHFASLATFAAALHIALTMCAFSG